MLNLLRLLSYMFEAAIARYSVFRSEHGKASSHFFHYETRPGFLADWLTR